MREKPLGQYVTACISLFAVCTIVYTVSNVYKGHRVFMNALSHFDIPVYFFTLTIVYKYLHLKKRTKNVTIVVWCTRMWCLRASHARRPLTGPYLCAPHISVSSTLTCAHNLTSLQSINQHFLALTKLTFYHYKAFLCFVASSSSSLSDFVRDTWNNPKREDFALLFNYPSLDEISIWWEKVHVARVLHRCCAAINLFARWNWHHAHTERAYTTI